MNRWIRTHLRMESSGQGLPFSYKHWVSALCSKHLDSSAYVNNLRSTNENHFEGRVPETSLPD